MARFSRRSFRTARKRPNLAWSGYVNARTVVAPGAQSTVTVCDATSQLAVGLTPVLQRIRASLVVDPDISPSALTAQFWTVCAAFHLNPNAPDLSSALGWADESILWSGIIHASSANRAIIQPGSPDVEHLGQYTINHDTTYCDIKARRRMENPQEKVYLSVRNFTSSTSNIAYSAVVRCLHAV